MKKVPFNPYIVGNPIKSKEMFFGREDDFQYVIRKISEGHTNQILIFCGDRRSGKTSILFQILLGRLGERFLPVLIDMQILAGIKDDAGFFKAIIDVACSQLNKPGLSVEDLEKKNTGSETEGLLMTFIREAENMFPDRILLFLLDEYELIETKIRDGSLSENIIHFLAGVLESTHRISFIFTGSTNLENRRVEYWKTLLGKSIYKKISYLSQNDTTRLITEPLKDYITYPESMTESIYRLTGGQPFYTQVICQNIVDLLIEEDRQDPLPGDLNTIVRDIVSNPLPQMIYSWNNLSDYVRLVLSALSGILNNGSSWAGMNEVHAYLKKSRIQLPFKKERLNIFLEEAYQKEFLEKNEEGLYRYRMDMFRQWIKKEHSVWKVVKEIGLAIKKPFNIVLTSLLTGIGILAAIFIWQVIFHGSTGDRVTGGNSAAGDGTMTQEPVPEGTGPDMTIVREIMFSANYGPFRVIIDNARPITSEGLPDEKTIVLESITKGEHSFIYTNVASGEKIRETRNITADNKAINIVFKKTDTTSVTAAKATESPAAVDARKGSIIISSNPGNAQVILNDTATEYLTPAIIPDIDPGDYTIRLELEGYRPEIFTLTLKPGAAEKKEVMLSKSFGSLVLRIRPTALVYFNNTSKIAAETSYPIETPRVKPVIIQTGRHLVTIKNESMNFERSITIEITEDRKTIIDWDIQDSKEPVISTE